MKYVLTFTLGALVGICAIWYFAQVQQHKSMPTLAHEAAADTNLPPAKPAIDGEKIKEEMTRTGQVIREKAREAGAAIADATANAERGKPGGVEDRRRHDGRRGHPLRNGGLLR